LPVVQSPKLRVVINAYCQDLGLKVPPTLLSAAYELPLAD
jgi:hypothetical protein